MEKKYKIIEDDSKMIVMQNRKAYRIVALRDFADVKKGDLGGYIETEENLSHEGLAWVYNDAIVLEMARVQDNATVHGNALICNRALIMNNAKVSDRATACNSAILKDYACAKNHCLVYDRAVIEGNSIIDGNSLVGGEVRCLDNTHIAENAAVVGNIRINGNSHIYGNVNIVMSPSVIYDADIFEQKHIIVFHGFGSRISTTTVYRSRHGMPYITCGCFKGTIDEFEKRVRKVHGENPYAKEYQALIEAAVIHFGMTDE